MLNSRCGIFSAAAIEAIAKYKIDSDGNIKYDNEVILFSSQYSEICSSQDRSAPNFIL